MKWPWKREPKPLPELDPEIEAECRCPRFGDEYCGYRGDEEWCDRTWTRCVILGNQDRFNMRQPPLRQREINWRVVASIVLTVATMLYVESWTAAFVLYAFASVLYLPHFWGPYGAFAALRVMLQPQPADTESATESESVTKDKQ